MDKYFEIKKDSPIYTDYFKWLDEEDKMIEIFRDFSEKHEIEASKFIPRKKRLYIIPTEKDIDKFAKQFTQNYGKHGEHQFKCNSVVGKDWVHTVADMPIPRKPTFWVYGMHVLGRFSTRLFHIGDKLYGSLSAEDNFELLDCMEEMKASEFYKIIESDTE